MTSVTLARGKYLIVTFTDPSISLTGLPFPVVALYIKSSGKHCACERVETIGAISNIGVELWQPMAGTTFSKAKTLLPTKQYDFITGLQFLTVLGITLQAEKMGTITLPKESSDAKIWYDLRRSGSLLEKVMVESRKRKKGKAGEDDMEIVDES